MRIIDIDSGIKVIIDDTYTISKGETLVETRNNFLDMMGRVFDEAIYNSLNDENISEDEIGKCLTGGRRKEDVINTVAFNTLKELQEYVGRHPGLFDK